MKTDSYVTYIVCITSRYKMQWSESIYCWKSSLIWPNRISQDALVWLIVHCNTGRRGLIWTWSKCWSNADVGDIIGILGLKCLKITMKKWLSYASTIFTSTISIYLITKKFSPYMSIYAIYMKRTYRLKLLRSYLGWFVSTVLSLIHDLLIIPNMSRKLSTCFSVSLEKP